MAQSVALMNWKGFGSSVVLQTYGPTISLLPFDAAKQELKREQSSASLMNAQREQHWHIQANKWLKQPDSNTKLQVKDKPERI